MQGSRCTSPLAGLRRTSSRLSGLSAACPLPSPPGGTLTCELQDCPFCASLLEDPEFAFSESDSCDSDSNGVYEFTQDLRHGDHRDQLQQQRSRRRRKKKKPKERNKVTRLWKAFGSKLKRIVESKYFNRGIMIAILINTLSMGIEYHEQVSAGMASRAPWVCGVGCSPCAGSLQCLGCSLFAWWHGLALAKPCQKEEQEVFIQVGSTKWDRRPDPDGMCRAEALFCV